MKLTQTLKIPRFVICIGLSSLLLFGQAAAQIQPSSGLLDSVAKKNFIRNKFKTVKDDFDLKGKIKPDSIKKHLFEDKLDSLKSKKNALKDSIKTSKIISLSDFAIENSTLFNRSEQTLNGPRILNNVSVSGQIKLFNFPLVIDLASNADQLQELDPRDALFKVNFDRSQYQQLYKDDLNKYSRFKKAQLSGLDIQPYLKKTISEKLKSSSLDPSKFQRLNTVLEDKEKLTALLSLNETQLRDKLNDLMPEPQYPQPGKPDSLLRKAENLSEKLDSLSNKKQQQMQEQIALKKQEIADEIVSLKHKMEDSGLDQQRLLLIQKFVMNKGSVNDMQALFENEINQQGKLTAFAKFYSKIKTLQAGDFSRKMPGSFMNRDQMVKGANFVFRTYRGPVSVGFGVNKDAGMPKDADFTGSMYDSPKLLTYVSIPTSNFSFGRGKLSWVATFDKQKNDALNQLNSLPKSGSAFIVSQDLNMNTIGTFTVEMSKSATQYKNVTILKSDKMLLNNDLKMGNYFKDDLLQTMSLGVKHNFQLKKFGFSSNTFFSYSGLGYQNPGQQGYSNMGMRMGANVKKSMLKNKVILNVRTDIKNTPISATSSDHWKNYNLQLDSRIKLSKIYTLNLKYAENGINRVSGPSSPVYSSQKLQADMNASYKIGKNYGLSHLSIGKQAMLNPASLTNSNFITVIYSQNIVMKSISLSGNAFYNKELSGLRILGDMLNADAGCQYSLMKKLNVSSAITYLDNQNIARQVGIRQNIQLSVLKNFDISAFLDVRKNLINPLYRELFPTGSGELSIRYYLNK